MTGACSGVPSPHARLRRTHFEDFVLGSSSRTTSWAGAPQQTAGGGRRYMHRSTHSPVFFVIQKDHVGRSAEAHNDNRSAHDSSRRMSCRAAQLRAPHCRRSQAAVEWPTAQVLHSRHSLAAVGVVHSYDAPVTGAVKLLSGRPIARMLHNRHRQVAVGVLYIPASRPDRDQLRELLRDQRKCIAKQCSFFFLCLRGSSDRMCQRPALRRSLLRPRYRRVAC